jgi:hypothetical protein
VAAEPAAELAATMGADLFPPPPSIRLRIGVSGHRVPPKLPEQSQAPLHQSIKRILTTVVDAARAADSYNVAAATAAAASEFVVVSSLAEGSDRIVAETGLEAGYTLEALLPFARAEYARDFATDESRAAFAGLLGRAAAVFELDGAAGERPHAYEAAGFVMLSNIDLLIAIWDGAEAAGIGGTAQIVHRAIADGIPVVRLDPQNPDATQLSWSPPGELPLVEPGFRSADTAAIAAVIGKILALPDTARGSLKRYLAEKERRWNFCLWYPFLLLVFAGRWPRSTDVHFPSIDETRRQWQKYFSFIPDDRAQRPAIERILLPAFDAADRLAVFYSLVYRSAYVFNFVFAALAVALALAGIFVHEAEVKVYFVGAELLIIISILLTWFLGQRRQWHRRWLEYRRLAESLRHIRILAPLGAEGPVDRPSDNVGRQDWVKWYAWSVRRRIPLPDRAVDDAYLAAIRDAARTAEIAEQAAYHDANAVRMSALETGIHHTGQIFFAVTGGMCALFVALYFLDVLPNVDNPHRDLVLGLFTFLTALLPTVGGALGAIFAQGDFRTVAEQSERTAKRLKLIDQALADEPLEFARLTNRIQTTSDIMMVDLEEWHSVFRTRPLSLPA